MQACTEQTGTVAALQGQGGDGGERAQEGEGLTSPEALPRGQTTQDQQCWWQGHASRESRVRGDLCFALTFTWLDGKLGREKCDG